MKGIQVSIVAAMIGVFSIQAQEWELVWSEEFDSNFLDTTVWQYEIGEGPNNELQYYTNRPDNIFIADGLLTLRAIKESYEGKNYTSGRINTHGKFNFTYGKIEASMKLPFGQGIWPAFWMLGESFYDIGWPTCGEIDIMEMVGGDDPNKGDDLIHSTLHWGELINGGHPNYGDSYQLGEGIFADTFHLFTTIWEEDVIRTYCDNILFYTITTGNSQFEAFDKAFFIILNLAVGGNWPGSPDATTVFPQDYFIDYVRVYKSAETIGIIGPNEVYPADSALEYSVLGGDDWEYEWLLPDDAEIVGPADTSSIFVNWGCGQGTIGCHITSVQLDDTFELNITIREPKIVAPLFFGDNETGLEFKFPLLAGSSYSWEIPEDATIVDGQGTASVLVDWGSISGYVTLDIENKCGVQRHSRYVLPKGQYPYPDPFTPHSIPGTIDVTNYDYGGEGIAYHDNQTENLGSGPRQDEGVDTDYNDGVGTIGWNEGGEWTEYTVQVEKTGLYDIDVCVATEYSNGINPLKIFFNGEKRTGSITIPNTGDWSIFTTVKFNGINIYDTDTLMRLDLGSGYNIGKIVFRESTGSGVQFKKNTNNLQLYPNPVKDLLYIENSNDMDCVLILNMSGQIQKMIRQFSDNTAIVNLYDLCPGFYILKAITKNNVELQASFVKL